MKKYFLLLIFSCKLINAQVIGGKSTFAFLNSPLNARVAGLGGELVSQRNEDPNLMRYNPASGNYKMNKTASVNYMSFVSGINLYNSNFVYAKDSTSMVWGGNISYLNYGNIDSYDEAGNAMGSFHARDYSITASAAKKLGNYSIGANLGLANSKLSTYTATAVYADLGGQFIHPKKDITIGLLIKNIGFNIDNYTKGNKESLPVDVQAGTTFKPKFMPIRFNFTLHHLYKSDISYYDPYNKAYTDQDADFKNTKPSTLEKALRHADIGIEALVAKGFNVRAGYSFMRRQDLKFQSGSSNWAGFSCGAMIKIKKFTAEYSQVFYHSAASKGILSLSYKI